MYDIIYNIIAHDWTTGSSDQQYIYYICGALIVLFSMVFVDLFYRLFSHCWRG